MAEALLPTTLTLDKLLSIRILMLFVALKPELGAIVYGKVSPEAAIYNVSIKVKVTGPVIKLFAKKFTAERMVGKSAGPLTPTR